MFFCVLFWQHGILSNHANKAELNVALRKRKSDVSCYAHAGSLFVHQIVLRGCG